MADKPKLNPNARTFNPSARAFVPGGPAAAAPAPVANSPAPTPPLNTPMSAPVLPDKQRSATAPVDVIASPTGAASPTAEQDSWEAAAPSPTAAAAAVDTASAAGADVAEHKAPAPSAVGLPVALKEDAPAAAPVTELPIPASSPVPDENIEMTEELKQELAEIAREEMEVGKKPPKKKNAAEEFKVRH